MAITLEQLREQIQGWIAPISGDAPAGASAKSDPAYDLVTGEVAKLESPTGGAVNWRTVADDGSTLLKTKSKDLLIASYVSYGLYETQGLKGLVTGVGVLHALIEDYWETCFPERARMRGRVNALAWFVQRTANALSQAQVAASDASDLDALSTAASALASAVRAKFENHAPAVTPLLESIQRLKLSLPEDAPPPPPTPPAPAVPGPTAAASAPTPTPPAPAVAAPAPVAASPAPVRPPAFEEVPAAGDLSAPGAGTEHLAKLGAVVASTARAMRQVNPQDPTAYRALRTGLWLHLVQPPPGGPDGKTSVPAPAANLRDRLEKLLANAKWPELLDEAESALSQNRLWLDLQHYSARALSALGLAGPREALIGELAGFLKRMPTLRTLQFNDTTPFADEGTRAWIDAEVLARPVSARAMASSGPAAGDDAALEEAHVLAAQGKASEAVERLEKVVAEARSDRDRFRARLALAQVCAAGGQHALARALFQRLDAEGLERGLDVWEPRLSGQVLEGLISCIQRSGKSSSSLAQDLESLQVRLFFIESIGRNAAGFVAITKETTDVQRELGRPEGTGEHHLQVLHRQRAGGGGAAPQDPHDGRLHRPAG